MGKLKGGKDQPRLINLFSPVSSLPSPSRRQQRLHQQRAALGHRAGKLLLAHRGREYFVSLSRLAALGRARTAPLRQQQREQTRMRDTHIALTQPMWHTLHAIAAGAGVPLAQVIRMALQAGLDSWRAAAPDEFPVPAVAAEPPGSSQPVRGESE